MGNAYRSVLAGGGAGTPITPSNSSPVSMTQGETYTPTANGKAVESVTDITPSSSSPPALSAGNIYKPGSSGYAIDSYSNISPSSSGTYFSSGMKKMSSSGYAYSSKPGESRTTLWSNSSPSSNFATQTVSLSQSIANFKYIAIEYKANTSSSTTIEILFTPTDLRKATISQGDPLFALAGRYPNTFNERFISYSSDTGITFSDARAYNSTTIQNSYAIPIKISGIN